MNKLAALLIIGLMFASVTKVHAQMMGFPSSSPDNSAIQAQQQEEQEGKQLLDDLKNGKTTCQRLTDDNFEKIGEYFMGQAIGNTSQHISMNNMMKSMMGEQGEEQMHIAWGKRGSGCDNSAQFSPMMGGVISMMGYGGMMNGSGWMMGFGVLGLIIQLLVIVVLVLLVVYLWKQIQRKK